MYDNYYSESTDNKARAIDSNFKNHRKVIKHHLIRAVARE